MEGLVRAPTDLCNDIHRLSQSRLAAPYDRSLGRVAFPFWEFLLQIRNMHQVPLFVKDGSWLLETYLRIKFKRRFLVKSIFRVVLLVGVILSAGSTFATSQFDTPMPIPTCGPNPPCVFVTATPAK